MKTNKFPLVLSAVGLILAGFQEFNEPILDQLKSQFNSFATRHPDEKVYVHFDKPFYKPGEDIWFNAFVVNGSRHTPTQISDVVYIQFKDPKGNNISTLELPVKEGSARGDFHLSEGAPGGIYTVSAFTQWMRNAGEESFFKKEIQVQKVITPRLLLKLEFEKEAYGAADEVAANLTVKNLKNEPIASAVVEAKVNLGGNHFLSFQALTDAEGKLALKFRLPDTLSTSDGLLQAIISTAGQQESISRSIPIVLNRIAIQFFPEGGDLVSGVESIVAFKAINEFGKAADVSGFIADETGARVIDFQSYHMGMGAFAFVPHHGKQYHAVIERPIGSARQIQLPRPVRNGFTLSMSHEKQKISCSIHAPENGQVFLVGQSHGIIYYAEELKVSRGKNSVDIPVKGFPSGIAVFTLFNTEGLEESERLIYLNKDQNLKVSIETDKTVYEPREKVHVKIKTTDAAGKPLSAKLSVSIADDQLISFADDKQDNILSCLMLSSEVKGKIEEPSFYFDDNEPKADQALDYLLLTHGWRRFTWKEVMANDKAIVFLPENNSTISGLILSDENENRQAEIVLLEIGNRRRIAKLKTTKDGQFVFKNIDTTIPMMLLTKAPNKIELQTKPDTEPGELAASVDPFYRDKTIATVAPEEITPPVVNERERVVAMAGAAMDLTLNEDVTQLSEVVTVGFGHEERSKLSASVAVIRDEEIGSAFAYGGVEKMLQGRVPGLEIQQQNANPSDPALIKVRGISSIAIGNEPLYIVDGQPITGSLDRNFAGIGMIDPEDISSIEVMHGPEASALFGSAAVNGVISITTKSKINFQDFQYKNRKAKYNSLLISPRTFSATREFFRQPGFGSASGERKDFNTTVYWNHSVITDPKGEASFTFSNNDLTTAFRITAEGIGATGLVGRAEHTYSTQLPFAVDTKIPAYLGFEDTLSLPVMIKNNTKAIIRGEVKAELPAGLIALSETSYTLEVPPGQTQTSYVRIVPSGVAGTHTLAIHVNSKDYADVIRHTVEIHPIGFPMKMSVSGNDKEKNFAFVMKDVEKGSVKGEMTAYSDILGDLFTGAESILREPHGCFEQVSSSTFPNILALQFLKESGQVRPQVEKQAMNYIKRGYEKLIAYEINGGGFEWFGSPPAHEGLTAYGLIEFHEMKKVYAGVDTKMIDRTRDWLLSRRNGDGTFKLQLYGLDDFSKPSGDVTNAYITYALSETGFTAIEKEYKNSYAEAWKSRDMYRLGLLANTAFNLGKGEDYNILIDLFQKQVAKDGIRNLHSDHSVVWSQGISLTNETLALWAIAMLKGGDKNLPLVHQVVQALVSTRSYGMFGSTQATILSLKALTEYAKRVKASRQPGDITIALNNNVTDTRSYTGGMREPILLSNFTKTLKEGRNSLSILFANTTEAMPYSMNVSWNTKTPVSNEACSVKIQTSLSKERMKLNETVRLKTVIENLSGRGQPMTMALVGIPAGLSVQPWQLKELQDKKVFDFYEIIGDRLALYYRQLKPREVKTINLDLKADVAGSFTGVASNAYLYYTDEYKCWVKGSRIVIEP